MKVLAVGLATLFISFTVNSAVQQPSATASSCEQLAGVSFPLGKITLAQAVTTGTFTMPEDTIPGGRGAQGQLRSFAGLPAFCRVAAELRPTADSLIGVEVWLPLANWNGKFMAAGNGGWSGAINYAQMAPILQRGYAVASTDTGHKSSGQDGSWALDHPEKLVDFGYRAVHEMTIRSKEIVKALYGSAPRYAYWNGCSSGGKQGLKEAQRFPDDYDGIIAGAPANYWTHLMTQIIVVAKAVRSDPVSRIPPEKYRIINDAVMSQCDALDGVVDRLLEDPRRCTFDPARLLCKASEDPSTCLSAPQVAALKQTYGPVRSRGGTEIYPGLAVGGERTWGDVPQPFGIAESHFKFVVFRDPNWDFRTLDVDRDVATADALDAKTGQLNATDPDLRAFQRRGGKLIQYHGWNDQQIAPQNSVNYYNSVVDRLGGRTATEDFYRLFMVPGMGHCQGGGSLVTDQFDKIAAIEDWVERGLAPAKIVAANIVSGGVDRKRPLCPYPSIAKWSGTGSTDDAASFTCRLP